MIQNENTKKWVAALRSGRYKQGLGWLNRGGRYCCLGVGCEVYIAAGNALFKTEEVPHVSSKIVSYDNCVGMPPDEVSSWLGISPGEADDLACWNDSGESFNQIADRIEQGKLEAE